MITEAEKAVLNQIEKGDKDTLSLGEKTQKDQRGITQMILLLGSKGLIEVEFPGGKPQVKTITERGRNILADNSWIFD